MSTVAGASATQRQREADEGEELRRALEGHRDLAVERPDEAERQRRREDHDDQHELDQPVEPERRADAVGQAPAERAADRHPAEEPGEDRRHGLRRVAEDEHQLP